MRVSTLSLGLLAVLAPLTAAWSKEDREIFRVRDELIAHEGPDITFYEFLGITPSASIEDINKAYKKRTVALHPDKVKRTLMAERTKAQKEKAKEAKQKGTKPPPQAVKGPTSSEVKAAMKRASERQARLSIVTNVLRGPGRDRYDHFLRNGFPTWKGTEYYYSRYRPGLGTVLFGVFLFGGGAAHYLFLFLSYKRQREFVERYIKFARHAAWGENMNIPGLDTPAAAPPPPPPQEYQDEEGRPVAMNRKMRRMQERDAKKEAAKDTVSGRRGRKAPASASASGTATPQPAPQGQGPTGAKKRVVAENGKVLVVDSLGDVYLEQPDEEGNTAEYLLDPEELAKPTFRDTAVVKLPLFLFRVTVGRFMKKASQDELEGDEYDGDIVDDEDSEPGKRTPSTDSAEEFELVEKSVDDLGKARSSGASQKQANRRKVKKRS